MAERQKRKNVLEKKTQHRKNTTQKFKQDRVTPTLKIIYSRATSTQPTARSFAYSLLGENKNHDTKALFKNGRLKGNKCANYRKMTNKYLGCWITRENALCSLKFDDGK